METISRILDYCDIPIPDRTEIAECLWRNSQEGSGIEQAFINDSARRLPDELRIAARKLLAVYGYSSRE